MLGKDKKIGTNESQRYLEEKTEIGMCLPQFMRVNTRDWGAQIQFYKSLFQVRCVFIVVKYCCYWCYFQVHLSEVGFCRLP